ncbi:MAG: hypothetical protein ACYDBZ_15845 [Steroidobacteraceae bacterium]
MRRENSGDVARESKKIGRVILRGAGANFSAGYDTHEFFEQVKAGR